MYAQKQKESPRRVNYFFLALFYLGVIAFFIIVYCVVIGNVNWLWNEDQDHRDLRTIDLLANLTNKDVALMNQDMVFMNLISDYNQRIITEEQERIAKDMILMGNATNLNALIDIEIQERIAKDEILAQNVSDVFDAIANFTSLDDVHLDLLLLKRIEIMKLNERIIQAVQDRLDKDMILMDNVKALDQRLDMLLSEINIYDANVMQQIEDFRDKDMQLMDNATQLQQGITLEKEEQIAMDTSFNSRLDIVNITCDDLENKLEILEANLTILESILEQSITTINEIQPDQSNGNFLLMGSPNNFDSGVKVTTNSHTAGLEFDFHSSGLLPYLDYTFRMEHFALHIGNRAGLPFFSCNSGACPSMYDPAGVAGGCTPGRIGTCESSRVRENRAQSGADVLPDMGARYTAQYPLGIPIVASIENRQTGGVKLFGKGSFVVHIWMEACFRIDYVPPGGADQTMGIFVDVGTRHSMDLTAPFIYTQCNSDLQGSDDQFPGCLSNNPLGINFADQCTEPCYPTRLSCTRHIHHDDPADITYVSARVYGYPNLERRCITDPIDANCEANPSGARNYIVYDYAQVRFQASKIY